MTKNITVNLISGRSIQQGVAIEGGKEKANYRTAAGIIELDHADLKALGAWKNTNVKVTSPYGSVIVKAIETTQGPHRVLLLSRWDRGQIPSLIPTPTQRGCRRLKAPR